ncbi:Type-2Aa cytolytic delta-endotoxin [Streptomyces sp. TRM66268-LWL]|uniref:Type-2Aa cytolytic delta-endotoxin n=1 Tax=Streptomyces polyasparticus TaxID=2767826 RepID=A0ABR7SN59_9ACTN|nr:Type-2Aa cytolytic delta-endotoxin [Streptomyces polyasparticus]MBC9715946.1 Type-2Aa cytolytic delta-endotoxin [Streptomyces polyasparticus]
MSEQNGTHAEAGDGTRGEAGYRVVHETQASSAVALKEIGARFTEALAAPRAEVFGRIQKAARVLPDSRVVRVIPGFGLQETAPVQVVVLTLKEGVRQALVDTFTNETFWTRVESALEESVTGLGDNQGAAHLRFLDGGPDSTSYTCDLLFALQDEETDGALYAISFCVRIDVALPMDRVLALTLQDTAQFAIRLDAVSVRQEV